MDIFGCRSFFPGRHVRTSFLSAQHPVINANAGHKSTKASPVSPPMLQDARMSGCAPFPSSVHSPGRMLLLPLPAVATLDPLFTVPAPKKCINSHFYVSALDFTLALPPMLLLVADYPRRAIKYIYIDIYNIALYIVYVYKCWICVDKFILLSTLGQGNLPGAGMRNWVKTWTLSYCRALAGVTTARLTLFYGYKLSIICVMLGLKTC